MNKLIKLRFLLPICDDFNRDIFFNLIQNLIGRVKLDEHYLDQSFKHGLSGEKVTIEQADVTEDWCLHTTKEDQIRQAFLLGYWAAKNFPVVGKKLHGLKWQPPERAAFRIDGLPTELSPDDVDGIIFKKMKIRLLELDVGQTTVQKLRLFIIDIPANTHTINETQLTEKIKSSDVTDECLEECWKMLRQGSTQQFHSGPKRQSNNELQSFDTDSPPAKRLEYDADAQNASTETAIPSSTNPMLLEVNTTTKNNGNTNRRKFCSDDTDSPPAKRLEYDADAQNASTDTAIPSSTNPMLLEVNTTTKNNGNTNRRKFCSDDTIRTCLLDIQLEIGKLSSFVHTTFSERENEGLNQHNILINRQDDEIAKLKFESKELRDSIGKLAKDYLAAQDGNEQKAALITALQKGIESTSKLQMQADRDLSASLDIIEVMKKDMAKLRAELEDHNSGNESTKLKLSKMKSENEKIQNEYQELAENYRKIFSERDSANRERQDLTATKKELAKMCTENERIRNEYKELAENYQEICSEREIANQERQQLTATKLDLAKMCTENERIRNEYKELAENYQEICSEREIANQERQQLTATKLDLAKMCTENERIRNEYKELAENYQEICSEREIANQERQQLTATKLDLAKMCTENERIRNEYKKLAENYQEICSEREIANRELTAKNVEIESWIRDMSMLREENQILLQQNQQLISDGNEFAATKLEMTKLSSENIQLKNENDNLQKAFNTLSSETEIIVAELKQKLDETHSSTSTTEKKSDAETQTDICTEVELELGRENIGLVDDQNFIFIISNGTQIDNAFTKEEGAESGKAATDQSLETEDVIVTECREKLLKLKFGWATFQPTKTAKFSPVFVYPADPDGKERAQKVVASGYVADEKNEFFEFGENVPDERKNKAGKTALKRLNERFKFSLV